MPRDASHDLEVDYRRQDVAKLRLEGFTIRQIAASLKTSKSTVQRDVDHLHSEAQAATLKDNLQHRTEVLYQLDELLALNWREGDREGVRKTLADKRRLLGLDSPDIIVHGMLNEKMNALLDTLENGLGIDSPEYQRVVDLILGNPDTPAGPTKRPPN